MKKIMYAAITILALAACNNQQQPQPEVKTAPALEASAANEEKPKIELASNEDPVCQMSVAEEYTDTTVYNGKIYAFCGAGCKEEFVANPTTYIK